MVVLVDIKQDYPWLVFQIFHQGAPPIGHICVVFFEHVV